MSNSKVLTKMWRDMKSNFEGILLKARVEDKLPSRKELMDHQESVQDMIDIFVTIAGSSVKENTSSKKQKGPDTKSTPESPSETPASPKSRGRRVFKQEHTEYLWSLYLKNHMQYLSAKQIQSAAREMDTGFKSVHYHLRKLIAAHRGVPVEQALDNAFSAQEDAAVWDRYTMGLDNSYTSEKAIVKGLGRELGRSTEEVRHRLLWLKAQQNHHDSPSPEAHSIHTASTSTKASVGKKERVAPPVTSTSVSGSPATAGTVIAGGGGKSAEKEARHHRPYTDEENATILQVCEHQTMTHGELARHLNRSKGDVLRQYDRLKLTAVRTTSGGGNNGSGDDRNGSGNRGGSRGDNGRDSDVPLVKVKTEPGLPTQQEEDSPLIHTKRTKHTHSTHSTPTDTTTTTTSATNTATTPTLTTTPYSHATYYVGQRYSPQEDEIILSAGLHPLRTSSERFEEVAALLQRSGNAVRKRLVRLWEDKGMMVDSEGSEQSGGSNGTHSGSSGDNVHNNSTSASKNTTSHTAHTPHTKYTKYTTTDYNTSYYAHRDSDRDHTTTSRATPRGISAIDNTNTSNNTNTNMGTGSGRGGGSTSSGTGTGADDRDRVQWFEDGRFSSRSTAHSANTNTHYPENITTTPYTTTTRPPYTVTPTSRPYYSHTTSNTSATNYARDVDYAARNTANTNITNNYTPDNTPNASYANNTVTNNPNKRRMRAADYMDPNEFSY